MFENFALGIDIEENSRFENKSQEFLNRIFTKNELDYSKKSKKYSQHLCARFCAKEAAIKALYTLGIEDVYLSDIEILNKPNGVPYIIIRKYPNLKIKVSLSHAKTHSVANVLIAKD